jgi:NADPH-dependent 7-cyano-7-deazaguanine reductase QueF
MKHEDETFQEQHIRKIHDMLTNLVSQRTTSVMAPSVIIGGKMFEE